MGPPQVVTDNSAAILDVYALREEEVECAPIEVGDTGGSGGSGGSGDGSDSTGPTYDLPYDTSCGCSTREGSAPLGVGLGLLVLALVGPWRRRE